MNFMNKKGFEFSVGVIVILIISIIIFSVSVYLLFKWFGEVDVVSGEIDRQTRQQIATALQTGNTLVSIPFPVQVVKRGQSAVFGVGIRNPGPANEFSMSVSFSNAYTPDGKIMPVDSFYVDGWLGSFAQTSPFLIDRNSNTVKPLLIKTGAISSGKFAVSGDYVFNVCVFHRDSVPCSIASYRAAPNDFYSNRMYQVTVRIR